MNPEERGKVRRYVARLDRQRATLADELADEEAQVQGLSLADEIVADVVEVGMRLVGQPLWWTTPSLLRAQGESAGFRVERQRRIFRIPGFLLPPMLTVARRAETATSSASAPVRRRAKPKT